MERTKHDALKKVPDVKNARLVAALSNVLATATAYIDAMEHLVAVLHDTQLQQGLAEHLSAEQIADLCGQMTSIASLVADAAIERTAQATSVFFSAALSANFHRRIEDLQRKVVNLEAVALASLRTQTDPS